jgi:hypothetical protein
VQELRPWVAALLPVELVGIGPAAEKALSGYSALQRLMDALEDVQAAQSRVVDLASEGDWLTQLVKRGRRAAGEIEAEIDAIMASAWQCNLGTGP